MTIYEAVNFVSNNTKSPQACLKMLRTLWINDFHQLTKGEKAILGRYIVQARARLKNSSCKAVK